MTRIDTTARYQDGELEKIIGRSSLPKDFEIDTKILKSDLKARRHRNGPSTNSLKVILNLSQVNTIYYRAPDFIIPIAVQARALNDQYKESRFKPSTFHGQYHLLCRSHEENLIPLLRRHNIHYAGYSPYPPGEGVGMGSSHVQTSPKTIRKPGAGSRCRRRLQRGMDVIVCMRRWTN
ncbi:hypothetical protein DOTSEDRAFT_69585 [Dothistroma septosporum NZE10]|uniref:NADP-dependent oxidoreductase domain-containing protein n=1 Tax=Dothistroma septosporum (strain NZE10 / CBS 128990) TaxID=675120 RepID=N1PW11_DOTSN|nr:hypothetical protein DOTSEDRAFT_69585 [Dothistroma septosporum NZE10]